MARQGCQQIGSSRKANKIQDQFGRLGALIVFTNMTSRLYSCSLAILLCLTLDFIVLKAILYCGLLFPEGTFSRMKSERSTLWRLRPSVCSAGWFSEDIYR